MQPESPGFWRKAATLLSIGLLAALLLLAPGRVADLKAVLFPPSPPPPIPRDTYARSQLAAELAAGPGARPAPASLHTLWMLVRDEHHFVRGQALEALAQAGEGARMDPRRADTIREIATDDTDWNRRSACVLLVQRDPRAALPSVADLWGKTANPNTKAALSAALRAAGAEAREALVRGAARREDDPVGRAARDLLRAL